MELRWTDSLKVRLTTSRTSNLLILLIGARASGDVVFFKVNRVGGVNDAVIHACFVEISGHSGVPDRALTARR